MKILHLASEYPPQKVFGLGRYVRDLSEEQVRQGHAVTVVTNSMGKELYETEQNGVRVLRTDFPPPPKPPWNAGCVMIFNIFILRRLIGLGVEAIRSFDGVQSHDWLTAPAAQAIQDHFGVPHMITFHDTIFGKRLGHIESDQDRFTQAAEGWAAARAAHVIANSSATREELIRDYGADPKRITVVPCAISPDTFPVTEDPVRLKAFRDALIPTDHAFLLYVGRLDPEKGVDVLIEAFQRANLAQVTLCLAGSGGGEGALREQVRVAGLEDRVQFLGYVENPALAHLYHVADLQICPSRYEPFGMVALEGMLQGTPVILSKTGGLAELIEPEVEGVFVEPGSVESLTAALQRFAVDRAAFEAMGQRARASVLAQRTWAVTAGKIQAVYSRQARRAGQPNVSPVTTLGVAAHVNDPYGYATGAWSRRVCADAQSKDQKITWLTTKSAPFFPVPTHTRDDAKIRDGFNLAVDLLGYVAAPPTELLATDWHGLLAGEVLRNLPQAPKYRFVPDPDGPPPAFDLRKEENIAGYDAYAQAWAALRADEVALSDAVQVAELKKRGVRAVRSEPISTPIRHAFASPAQRDHFRRQVAEPGELIGIVALRLEPPFDPRGLMHCLEVIVRQHLPMRLLICGDGFLAAPLRQAVE
ncbi:MAG: glycosyltransferase family 4 protein [Planctomycetota bacterium]